MTDAGIPPRFLINKKTGWRLQVFQHPILTAGASLFLL